MASPQKDTGPDTRTNFDKRSIRKMYAVPFEHAIRDITQQPISSQDEPVLAYSSQDVQVFCRKRPINSAELGRRIFDVLKVGPAGAPTVFDCRIHRDMRHLQLNNYCFPVPCFDEHTTTEQVCEKVRLDEFYELAARGGHGTLCMFGQTGSGKTYTMGGILRHTAANLFRGRRSSLSGSSNPMAGLEVRIACFEVCGKNCYDLLRDGSKVDVREDAAGTVQVSATSVEIKSGQALLEVVTFAGSQRMSCSTLKNEASSRSHAFYRILMRPSGSNQRQGSLTFVDLAGSERSGDSLYHSPQQVQQSAEINASLSALKDCVRVRSQQLHSNTGKRVPYRSSRLTMLLRDSFDTEGDENSGAPCQRLTASGSAPLLDRGGGVNGSSGPLGSPANRGRPGAGAKQAPKPPLANGRSGSGRVLPGGKGSHTLPSATARSPTAKAARQLFKRIPSSDGTLAAGWPPGDNSSPGVNSGGVRARTVVIVTAAPGCDDTEHTLNTLRTACMMAGLEGRPSRDTQVKVSLDDNEEHREMFTATVKHPTRWSADDVATWFDTACGGAFSRCGGRLPVNLDGRALARMPELRFRQFCNGDARLGTRLYKAFKDETQRANDSKASATEAVRTAKAGLKNL